LRRDQVFEALNEKMRSKTHTALTAPWVLHHTRIYKSAMKKIIFNGQMRKKHFLIVIYHSSLVKATVNAVRVCKFRNGVKKCLNFFFFQWQRRNKEHSALVNCGGIKFLKLR
jgi:hypothetical protein